MMTPEQRAERLRYHMYDTNEGIREHAERIVDLEELVADLFAEYMYLRVRVGHSRMYLGHEKRMREIEQRMRDLGIEVDA